MQERARENSSGKQLGGFTIVGLVLNNDVAGQES